MLVDYNNILQMNVLYNGMNFMHSHVMYLNNSKFFAGIVMIMLNIGSKFISIQFSQSAEEYLKLNVTKQILVFSMAWMGTRDIYTSLVLTAVFVILSDHLFNEESPYCVVPYKYRILHSLVDINSDNKISDEELNAAMQILEKAKKEKEKQNQKQVFTQFYNYEITNLS